MQNLNAIYTSILGMNSQNAEQTETFSSVTSQISTMRDECDRVIDQQIIMTTDLHDTDHQTSTEIGNNLNLTWSTTSF